MSESAPQVIEHPARGRAMLDQGNALLPAFPQVAEWIDRWARRIPWWAWVGGVLLLTSGLLPLGRLFRKAKSITLE